MDFKTLYEKISPHLKRIAQSHKPASSFIDIDDLYQEMCMHLWNNFKDGVPANINIAYVIKGCQFHILNYIRKKRDKAVMISLENAIQNDQSSLMRILPNRREEEIDIRMDRIIAIDYIKNNGFTKREKDVFLLLLQGHTVREVGKKLGISHVMVLRYKQSLTKKWQRKNKI